ncbi:MAG: hypothetical protein KAT62_03570 [Desulfuromonadales bacterium]|nr:hypothetical protein [Desulfuromonadales bacterium]
MRRVKVSKYENQPGDKFMTKVADGEAKFHQFGMDYEEFDNGAGNFSTAIIEREDGKIENVPVEMVEFIEA